MYNYVFVGAFQIDVKSDADWHLMYVHQFSQVMVHQSAIYTQFSKEEHYGLPRTSKINFKN